MPYPGGKNGAGTYQRIINLMPPHETYIEPFLGGGAIMRLKRPARLNIGLDLDASVISAWRVHNVETGEWRRSLELAMVATSAENSDSRRRRTSETAISAETAENGDARSTNARTGDGILPPETAILPEASSDPARVDVAQFQFLNQDGISFLKRYRFHGSELVYADPPYLLSTRGNRRIYRYELKDSQHRKLLSTIVRLPCMVMISGYWSEIYATALKSWNSIQFQSMTRGGRPATEWLWFNFPEPVALHDYRFLGKNFRERERIKRKKLRWTNRLAQMPLLEKRALLSAIASTAENGGAAVEVPDCRIEQFG
jgi:DNA adenine methylase